MSRPTSRRYEDNVGADVFVAQAGTRNFFGGVSSIPVGTVDGLERDPAVDWAAAVRGFFSILDLHGRKVPAYVIGSTPGEPGGPWELREGRAPRRDNEVAVGWVMARRHGLDLGDTVEVTGSTFEIVGISPDAFMFSFVFMTHGATDRLLGSDDTTSFVLVATDDAHGLQERFERTSGLAVLDRDELARNDLRLMARAYDMPLKLMRGVAFAIGSLVVALTAYTSIAEHRREYGIVKAIGARGRDLVGFALVQTFITTGAGLVAGGLFFIVGRQLIGATRPQFVILATGAGLIRVLGAALVMAVVAAVVPARRLAALAPATAYRDG